MTDLDQRIAELREDHSDPSAWSREAMSIIDEQAAEIERLREAARLANDGWHMANDVADLAMKHRDAAEKQLAAAIMKAGAEAADEFAAVDAGPTPLRGRITDRSRD